MKKIALYSLLLCLLLACEADNFEPLSFFEVTTSDYEDLLDAVSLSAIIKNGKKEANLEYGFLYSPSNSSLSFENTNNVTETPLQKDDFASNEEEQKSILIESIEIGQPYFYRAFVRSNERVILGEILTFITGQAVGIGMDTSNISINNNSVLLGGFVAGLFKNYKQAAINHGHIYSKTAINNDPFEGEEGVLNKRKGRLEGDRSFVSEIENLDFNTEYIAKAYIQLDEQTILYSNPVSFQIRDGWRLHSTLDTEVGLQRAIAFTLKNKAYLGIGCPENCSFGRVIGDLYEFDPSLGLQEDIKPISNLPTGGRGDGVAFNINDTIYFGDGVIEGALPITSGEFYNFFPENADFDQWISAGDGSYPELERHGAVAFVIGNKAYYGLGESFVGDKGLELSDFYEFDPSKLANFENPWRPQTNLDLAVDGYCNNIVQLGRKNAVAFALNGKGYVLAGFANDSSPVSDFWEFTPDEGLGTWTCLGAFPGGIRSGGSVFIIDDVAYITAGRVSFVNEFPTDVWAFDGTNWEEKQSFPGSPRTEAVAFALNGKGYLATGRYTFGTNTGLKSVFLSDIWEYIPEKK